MKALVYHGPRNVSVDNVDDSKIEHPNDAVVRITATNICGSDLHMYEGRTDFEEGRTFGHENVGEVVEVRLRDAYGAWRWVEAGVQNVLEGPGDTGLLVVDLRDLSGRRGLAQPTRPAYRDAFAGLFAYEPPMRNGGRPARSHNPTG